MLSSGSYQWIKDQLEAEAPGKKLIFCKDMVEGIEDRKEMIPSGFRHVFLIRHPAKVMGGGGRGEDAAISFTIW